MIIKVPDGYLEFDGDIETERQANLFEDISEVNGDYSYSFEVQNTATNRAKLGIVNINEEPTYTQKLDCTIYSDAGEDIYYGYLRVESVTDVISLSFFGGNNAWFVLTERNIRDYNFTRFDKDFTYTNVINSHGLSNGVIWPLVDRGTLNLRDTATVYDNDWQPFIYVKDVVRTVLNQEGIKLEGDILKDPLYNALITSNNGLSGVQDKLDALSVYANKGSIQSITTDVYTDIAFSNFSVDPYFIGDEVDFDGTTYTVVKPIITAKITVLLTLDNTDPGLANSRFRVLKNGVSIYSKLYAYADKQTIDATITLSNLEIGDTIKIQIKQGNALNDFDILLNSSLKIEVLKLRAVSVSSLVPDLTANEYIASIFSRFNCFVSYDGKTQTINTKFLDNIVKETPIDISQYVESFETDYTTIADEYAQRNNIIYQESGEDNINTYNSINETPYGGGVIEVDNEFIEKDSDLIELEEIACYQAPISWLGFSLPVMEYTELNSVDSKRFTSVSDSSGYASFAVSSSSIYSVGDLVRIVDSNVDDYNGIVARVQSIVLDTIITDYPYISTASGTLEIVSIDNSDNEDQVILLNLPSTALSGFTDTPEITWQRSTPNTLTSVALAYFWLPQVNKPINTIGKALYFDKVNDPQAYQLGLIDGYFRTSERILNNPIVKTAICYLPEKVFRDIDFLRPVRIETEQFTSNFLVNRITGYKGQTQPCELELIKIS
jgi:hypothetical protein